MAVAVFCGFVIKQCPINAIQMLWVNVIMDSFSSIALASEPPTDELLLRPPTKKREHIVTQVLWNAICFQAICQFILLMFVLFLSPGILGIPSSVGMEVPSSNSSFMKKNEQSTSLSSSTCSFSSRCSTSSMQES